MTDEIKPPTVDANMIAGMAVAIVDLQRVVGQIQGVIQDYGMLLQRVQNEVTTCSAILAGPDKYNSAPAMGACASNVTELRREKESKENGCCKGLENCSEGPQSA